jgi:hypothetical protein
MVRTVYGTVSDWEQSPESVWHDGGCGLHCAAMPPVGVRYAVGGSSPSGNTTIYEQKRELVVRQSYVRAQRILITELRGCEEKLNRG